MARSRRFRHSLAAAALAIPLVASPVLAPVAASAADTYGTAPTYDWGSWSWITGDGSSDYGYGSYGGYGSDDGGYGYSGGSGDYGYPGGYGAYGGNGGSDGSGDPYSGGSSTGTTQTDAGPATAAESAGVVLVNTTVDYGDAAAAGTGLVLTSDGIIVTNHHVVQGATKIEVTDPSTKKTYTAKVLGYDSVHDIAVLQLAGASGLTPATTDRAAAKDGEQVTSVGNAEGRGSLTAADGSVTDPSTAITVTEEDGSSAHLSDLIEVDADVVSGDSGGALLDDDGEVIGMNVAASSGSAQVSGYAIPIDRVLDIAAEIMAGKETGDVKIGYAAALGVSLDGSDSTRVVDVVDGGGAAKAGLAAGDTIESVDGTSVSTLKDITTILGKHEPGDQVSVRWTDADGAAHTATVTLGAAPIA